MQAFLNELVGPEAAQQILEKHNQILQQQAREQALQRAVDRAGGRNAKAIRAMLGDAPEDPEQAVAQLKRENPWLFVMPQVSSPGTGALTVSTGPTMEDVGKMSMAEYKRYRQGR